MSKKSILLQKGGLLTTAVLLMVLCCHSGVLAAQGEPGRPGDKGQPPGQGNRPGDPATRQGDLLGDLRLVVRDLSPEGDGKPVYFKWAWANSAVGEDGLPEIVAGDLPTGWSIPADQSDPTGCVQPISLSPVYTGQLPYADAAQPYLDSYGVPQYPVYLIPLDGECNIPAVYANPTVVDWDDLAVEVDLSRLSLARTNPEVIKAAYDETLTTINTAKAIGLDAAGRLLLTLPATEAGGADVLKTIDSPRDNLALYQKLMQESCLTDSAAVALSETAKALFISGGLGYLVTCDANKAPSSQDLLRAASFFAGAADKFGHVGIDEVVYENSILGINTVTVQPDGGLLVTGYKDLGNFTYTRTAVHGATTATLLQPVNGSNTTFAIVNNVTIIDKVFALGDPAAPYEWRFIPGATAGSAAYPLMNFVRATDDALAILYYIHNFEPPVSPVIPVR